jgi:hypothetical protein
MRLVGDACFDSSIGVLKDTSPEAGLQPDCTVFDVRDAAPDQEIVIPPCAANAGGDCYDFVADATECVASQGNLELVVTRAFAPTPDTWTHVICALASTATGSGE